MNSHTEARRLLQAAADGCLAAAERAWLDEHLAVCPQCRHYAADLDRLQAALVRALRAPHSRAVEPAALPPDIAARAQRKLRLNRLLGFANTFTQAASLLVIAVLLVNLLNLRNYVPPAQPREHSGAAQTYAGQAAESQVVEVQFPAVEFEDKAGSEAQMTPAVDDEPARAWIMAGRLKAR